MKLTKKLFIAIMTMALLVVTFGTSTFAWFTLGETANIETINVNVTAGKGMELSLDGKKWTNTAKLTVAEGTVDFQDLTSADGIAIKTMENTAAKSNLSELDTANGEKGAYFEQVIYVRITKGDIADFTKVLLDYVAGKDVVFTTANGTAVSDTAPADANLLWVSDATLAGTYNSKQIAENKYYRFDPLNAVKISFQGKGTSANAIYGYENSESWGSAATDELAADYAEAKEFDTNTAPTTLPASYATYTASSTTADANGFVKYDTKASTASEKESVLISSDFGAFADLGLSTGENPIYGDDVNYTYAKLTIRVWLEGWDADCINAILEKDTHINLGLKASN